MCKWILCKLDSMSLFEEIGKSGILDQDSSSNTISSQRRSARNCLVDDRKQQNHSDNRTTMLGGMETINGLAKAGAKAGTLGRMHLGATPSQGTIPRLCRTWNGDARLFDDQSFDVLMYSKGTSQDGWRS